MAGDYKLSTQLVGHDSDVRAVCFPTPSIVVSTSRDCTVQVWRRTEAKPPAFEAKVLSRASQYVNSVAFCPPQKKYPNGLVISGGKDAVIEVKSPASSMSDNAERLLIGHAHNVCTLDVSPGAAYIASGGWDGQAFVWSMETWEVKYSLLGHEGLSVWSVLAFDDRTVVTGCADKCIRVFDLKTAKGGEVKAKATIYTPDVVRALCKVPPNHPSGARIASANNDGVLRLWSLDGQEMGELVGHESFVYSLASLPSGELVSAGEDRTVRIWRDLECIQTITHPAISVWTVAVNDETGDIVTGASDGVARIFTRRPDQVADEETIKILEEVVRSSAIPQQAIGRVDKEKLPGPEFLTTKSGTKDGQVQMIREGDGSVTAHQWSVSQQTWISVGTVVDAVASTGKKVEYAGQSYDFVFDVDIEDGKPPLKLPYNLNENPYERATKFLHDNELPLSYLDSVANFITSNTGGVSLGQSQETGPDPYGTESRYRPGDSSQPEEQARALPQKKYLFILSANLDAILNKITNINKTMIASGQKDLALNPEQMQTLWAVRHRLDSSVEVHEKGLEVLTHIATTWPYRDRLAGLDLLRCVAKFPICARYDFPSYGSLIELVAKATITGHDETNDNAVMMAVRAIANLFHSDEGRKLVASQADEVFSFVLSATGSGKGISQDGGWQNRNVTAALSTCLLNYVVLRHEEKALTDEQCGSLMEFIGAFLSKKPDSETVYRCLVALGTLWMAAPSIHQSKTKIKGWIEASKERCHEQRIQRVADECLALLSR